MKVFLMRPSVKNKPKLLELPKQQLVEPQQVLKYEPSLHLMTNFNKYPLEKYKD